MIRYFADSLQICASPSVAEPSRARVLDSARPGERDDDRVTDQVARLPRRAALSRRRWENGEHVATARPSCR